MNLTSLIKFYHRNIGDERIEMNLLMVKALIFVVENFFLQLASSYVLTLSCQKSARRNFCNELLGKYLTMWDTPIPIQIVEMPQYGKLHVPGRRYCNVIFVNSFEAFRLIDIISYTADYNINEYYYIVLQNRNDLVVFDEMDKIFNYCWQHYIINCNVQLQNAKGEQFIYTYYPFAAGKCGIVTTVLINQFSGDTLMNEVLYPKKLKNMHGCELSLATWDVPPFVYLEKMTNETQKLKMKGIESRLVLELSRKMNFTIKVMEPPNSEQRGLVKDDRNLTGALLMLQKRKADFSLGCFRLAFDRALFTTFTFSYYHSTQVICIPMAAYKVSSLEILLFPFRLSAWLMLLAIWIIIIGFTSLIKKFCRRYFKSNALYPNTYLNIFLMAVGMPPISFPEKDFARFLFISWMAFTLILRTIYQALLFHFIRTQPTNRFPTSINDLVKMNYTLTLNKGTYLATHDVQFLTKLNLHIINESDETIAFQYVEKHSHRRLVAAGPLDFLAHYGIEHKKAGIYRLLPQHIVSLPLSIYLTKHSYLIDQFDEELMRLCSMGFIDIWTRSELDYNYLRKEHFTRKSRIFGLAELYMLFVIGLTGLWCCFIIFTLEILSKRTKILKQLFRKNI